MKKIFAVLSIIPMLFFPACSDENDLNLKSDESADSQDTRISRSEARNGLFVILNELKNKDSRSGFNEFKIIDTEYSLPVKTRRSRSEEPMEIHIFNFADNKGFAIMGGDKNMPDLLAISNSGSLNPGEPIENPGLNMFMSYVIDSVSAFSPLFPSNPNEPLPTEPEVTYNVFGAWSTVVYENSSHCPVKWGQKKFNLYCLDSNGQRASIGCVPVAVAQLMAVYKFPPSYKGYDFDWNDMTALPKEAVSNEGDLQINKLMYFLGSEENLDAEYHQGGSPANQEYIPRTLENFSYSSGGTLKHFNTMDVVREIIAGHPVILGGYAQAIGGGPNDRIGHYWLIHGLLERRCEVSTYDSHNRFRSRGHGSNWYLLCNWGWEDSPSDGYYWSGAFDTSSGPDYSEIWNPLLSSSRNSPGSDGNYQYDLKMVTGIRK